MSDRDLFLVTEVPGFTPQIGFLLAMMNYVRSTTLTTVTGLGITELGPGGSGACLDIPFVTIPYSATPYRLPPIVD